MANSQYIDSNRSLWNEWAKLHIDAPGYDLAGFKVGRCTLKPIELEELGDVSGKTLLHLQCHFGMDTLSWARRGAVVTGADLSNEAVSTARALSQELGIPARFVCAELNDLPEVSEVKDQRFDIVFTSYGTVTWMPDLKRWAAVIAHFLKPGGVFYMVDIHRITRVLFPRVTDSRGNKLHEGYFARPKPARAEEHGSYANPEAEVWTTAFYWSHSMGEIVTALIDAGLALKYLHEFPPGSDDPPIPGVGEPSSRDYPRWFSVKAVKS